MTEVYITSNITTTVAVLFKLSLGNKRVHGFPKDISLRLKVIARTAFNVAVHVIHFCFSQSSIHYITKIFMT